MATFTIVYCQQIAEHSAPVIPHVYVVKFRTPHCAKYSHPSYGLIMWSTQIHWLAVLTVTVCCEVEVWMPILYKLPFGTSRHVFISDSDLLPHYRCDTIIPSPQNLPLLIVNLKPALQNLHPKPWIHIVMLPVVCIMICFLVYFRYRYWKHSFEESRCNNEERKDYKWWCSTTATQTDCASSDYVCNVRQQLFKPTTSTPKCIFIWWWPHAAWLASEA